MKKTERAGGKRLPPPAHRTQKGREFIPCDAGFHLGVRLLCLLGMVAFLAQPAAGQNVSVTDYSVPVSRANNLRIDILNFNWVTEGDDVRVETGDVGLIYKKFYESLPFAYSVDFIGSASYSRDLEGNRKGRFATELGTRIKKYVRDEGNIFILDDTNFSFDKEFDRPSIDLTIGFGYGRSINATALRKAVRIEDFFLKEGILSDHMPKETMIELGHIIEKRPEYEDLYGDRYQNYWFEDMSNEITKSGLVLGSVGAIGILRMREVLFQERINQRFYGWETTAGVRFQLQTAQRGVSRPSPAMSIGLRYTRPISWRSQVNERFEINSPFTGSFGRVYDLTQTTDFFYELTNRVDFRVDYMLDLTKARRDASLVASHAVIPAFLFYVENEVRLLAGIRIVKPTGDPWIQELSLAMHYKAF